MISDSVSPNKAQSNNTHKDTFHLSRIERVLKASFFFLLAGFSIVLLFSFFKRIFYPFELEWMEGEILCSALRFAEGKAIYPDPAGNFVPFLYPPLYYWLIGLLIPWFGPHLWIGRFVSVFSFFAICLFIYRIVYRQTGDRMVSLLSFLLLPVTYKLTGFWFDIVRADSLFLALSLGGLFFLDKNIKTPRFWISLCLLIAAFFTKQTAVFFIAAALLILWKEERRASLFFFFLLLIFIGGILLILNSASGGWYWFYTFEVATHHKTDLLRGFGGGLVYILRHLPVVCGIIFYGLFSAGKSGQIKKVIGPWIVVLPFAFVATALPYGKAAGFINNFYNVFIFICILFGICLKWVLTQTKSRPRLFSNALWGILILQIIALSYNPTRHIPKESDVQAGRKFIEEVSRIDGEVYIPEHSFYGIMAQKKMYPKQFAVVEVKRSFPDMNIAESLKNKISQREFKAIYTDRLIEKNSVDAIDRRIVQYYQIEKILEFTPENAFEQFTGYRQRPNVKYIPKPDA